MELIIKISKEDFEIMKHNIAVNNPLCPLSQEEMVAVIAKGIPLPAGHGDLIDRKDLIENGISKGFCDWYDEIKDAQIILEADKEGRK